MNPDDRLTQVARELPPPALDARAGARVLRRARRAFEAAHQSPRWLLALDRQWERAEPALVAASGLWMLTWAAAVVSALSA